ncbi:MAG: tripartite tricarboxylate transporter substrate binding protein [Rhizobiales bacterium]|nr:tripartite tricarboxylate transporter substrate binding protein [Hyphomicrobiales bacterium]
MNQAELSIATNHSRRWLVCAGMLLMAVAASGYTTPVCAQGKYPDKPVRIVLPFGAGGVADVTARLVAEKLGEKLGQRFVVENQPGAGGVTAARSVQTAPADGYTLALLSNGTAISVPLFKNLPFDPVKDFTPISSMGYFQLVFVTSAQSPYKTLGDFIKTAKEKSGQLNVGTITAGSSQHLTAELFKSAMDLNFVIVPFKNSGEVAVALERGDVQLAIDFLPPLRGGLSGNKFLAVATSGLQRSPDMPNVPTVKEASGRDFEVTSWNAIYAPAGTPPAVIKTLNDALRSVLADSEIKKKALDLGIEAKASTPDEIHGRLKSDIAKWTAVIEKAGIQKR